MDNDIFTIIVSMALGFMIALLIIGIANSDNQQQPNIKICDTNITITHTDKGYTLPYYIVYSENHSYRVLNDNKWIYQIANGNIGNRVEIKYKSYYNDQGDEIREIVNIKSNWDNNCDTAKSCYDKED